METLKAIQVPSQILDNAYQFAIGTEAALQLKTMLNDILWLLQISFIVGILFVFQRHISTLKLQLTHTKLHTTGITKLLFFSVRITLLIIKKVLVFTTNRYFF